VNADAIVIGAGAAGLAAARGVAGGGFSAVVLEARDRIGGRARTLYDPRCPAPIELGAEFIHGTPQVTIDLMQLAGVVAVGEGGSSWVYRGSGWQREDDLFERVTELAEKIDREASDESVEAFLSRYRRDPRYEDAARWMERLVEGFDAADPAQASAHAIAQEWCGAASLRNSQARPSSGYERLLGALARALPLDRVRVDLQTVVHEIEWGERGVIVRAERFGQRCEYRARMAIVTLPIGVLASGTVQFIPPLPAEKQRAISSIAMGPVVKIALRFGTRFWADLQHGRFADAAFFSNFEGAFATFWTSYPIVSPLIVGWAGGPRARRFTERSEAEIVSLAIDEIAAMFSIPRARVLDHLEAAYVHDWQRDPYALGAYSYLKTGGVGAREALATPVNGTLFFAGEAAAGISEAGTVAGALISGATASEKALLT
jgi:monoamine oxidase